MFPFLADIQTPVISPVLIIYSAVLLLMAITICLLFVQISKLKKKWQELLTGASGKNIEHLLYDHLREKMTIQEELKSLQDRVGGLESRMQSATRHVGIVWYDAFADVGGSQSFSFAMLDDNGDGAVISSLIGRSDCRVYGKLIVKSGSDRPLTDEEKKAISLAKNRM